MGNNNKLSNHDVNMNVGIKNSTSKFKCQHNPNRLIWIGGTHIKKIEAFWLQKKPYLLSKLQIHQPLICPGKHTKEICHHYRKPPPPPNYDAHLLFWIFISLTYTISLIASSPTLWMSSTLLFLSDCTMAFTCCCT